MRVLKMMPPSIASTEELMACAEEMEKEAARKYREMADRMRSHGQNDLASLFSSLAEIEDKHAGEIVSRAKQRSTHVDSTPSMEWQSAESADEEDGSSRLLTPYRALAIAVRNEDRAFAFYSYVAADAPDEATRMLAEDLAREELEHAHALRRERRAAFRHQRLEQPSRRHEPETLQDLWALSAEAEGRAARYHEALATKLAASDPTLSRAFSCAAKNEEACAAEAASRSPVRQQPRVAIDQPTIADGLRFLEESFERYADIAEHTKDESIMLEAQRLAEGAVRRLSLVSGSINDSSARDGERDLPAGGEKR